MFKTRNINDKPAPKRIAEGDLSAILTAVERHPGGASRADIAEILTSELALRTASVKFDFSQVGFQNTAMCCIAPSSQIERSPADLQHGLNYEDTVLLRAIENSGRRAPDSPGERARYERLIRDGYIQSLPLEPMPNGMGGLLVCELTAQGKGYLAHS
jgi:hypothetical protein